MVPEQVDSDRQKKLAIYLIPSTKMNSKWIINLNESTKTTELLEEIPE